MNKEEKEAIFEDLVKHTSKKDRIFTLDGPTMVTVKMHDNTFRKKSIGSLDFYLTTVYAGARDLIFVFDSVDASAESTEYKHIEVPSKDMDSCFPLFLQEAVEWARGRYVPADGSRLLSINNAESFRGLVNMILNFEKADSFEDEIDTENQLTKLPTFGMF